MQIHFIVLFLLTIISIIDGNNTNCTSYENNIYQITTNFPNYQPYYILLTLLSNGIFFEETNIQNGQSSAELGVHLVFGTRTGYYECLDAYTVHLTNFGYIFKTYEVPVLATNGAIIIQDYYLYFENNNTALCTGTLRSAFFTTGTNPLDDQNSPTQLDPIRNLTCVLLSGRHYIWPASEQ
jgi:hypothetical protein